MRAASAAAVVAILSVMGCGDARACAIDGVPSLLADGVRAVTNPVAPTRATVHNWAPFVFRTPFRTGRAVHFGEDLRALEGVLPPEVLHGRWHWRFGDGTLGAGVAPWHRYASGGRYLVTVYVTLPGRAGTFTFDAAIMPVVERPGNDAGRS